MNIEIFADCSGHMSPSVHCMHATVAIAVASPIAMGDDDARGRCIVSRLIISKPTAVMIVNPHQ